MRHNAPMSHNNPWYQTQDPQVNLSKLLYSPFTLRKSLGTYNFVQKNLGQTNLSKWILMFRERE